MIVDTNSDPIVSGKNSLVAQTYYSRLRKPQQVLRKPYDDNGNDGGVNTSLGICRGLLARQSRRSGKKKK